MNELNTVLIEGTLKREPKVITSKENVCELAISNKRSSIGSDGSWKTTETVVPAMVFGPVADACIKFVKKGRGIRIVGRISTATYNNGKNHKFVVIAEHIEFKPEEK